MLTRLAVRNFKLFDDIELDLGQQVVLIGPNNAGKTTALQALALWDVGLKRWLEKRGADAIPSKRPGVTVNRRDLIALSVPTAKLLWRDLHTHAGGRYEGGRQRTEHVRIEIVVDGVDWSCGLEFDYANEESFYCRPLRQENGERMPVPEAARDVRVAYLPPMSGLAANETRLDQGAINVRLGEGRTAEVLRNLCYRILEAEDAAERWQRLDERIHKLFGSRLDEPKYIAERGEISMSYRTHEGLQLDLSACGRGQQQTMLLLAHMAANPGSVLLLNASFRRGQHPAAELLEAAAAIARTRSVPSDNKVASYFVLLPPKVSVSLTIASLRGVSMKSIRSIPKSPRSWTMSCSGRAWINWSTSRLVAFSRQRLNNTPERFAPLPLSVRSVVKL